MYTIAYIDTVCNPCSSDDAHRTLFHFFLLGIECGCPLSEGGTQNAGYQDAFRCRARAARQRHPAFAGQITKKNL